MLDFSQNGINIIFEITEQNTVILKHFSTKKAEKEDNKDKRWCNIAEIHVSGENQNDHHGAKHTGGSRNNDLKYVSHNYYENEYGNKLEFNLSDGKMDVTVHYQFYKDISALRAWTTVKNISDTKIGLEYVSSFAYTGFDEGECLVNDKINVYVPHNSWEREVNWKKYSLSDLGYEKINYFSTKRISFSNTGTWSSKEYLPMGAIQNNEINDTFLWQIENNGSWQWEISDIAGRMYLKISGPTEQENHWYDELKSGEVFESVKVCVCLGTDFNSALSEMTKYRRAIFKNNKENATLPVIFNDFMNCLCGDPTEEKELPMIDKAKEAGAEYYCIDAGWYADGDWWDTVGEWQPCKWRFPNGIKKVLDYIRKKGMIPGLWLEIEVMGINCPIANKFEDECFFMRHGKKVIDHGRYQFDFRNDKVRKYAMSVIDRLVNEYGVGYIKMDYNIDGGIGTEVDADSYGDGLLKHNRAYLSWLLEVKEKYPSLIIECCSSGGMRMDYAMLSYGHVQSVSDQTDYRHNAVISASAQTAVLAEQGAIWSYPLANADENAVAFNMVNSMMQRIHLSGKITELSKESFSLVKEGVECYKQIREDIKSSIPFYPIGIPQYNSKWLCLGHKNKNFVRMAIWKMDTDESKLLIPIEKEYKNAKIIYPKTSNSNTSLYKNTLKVEMKEKFTAIIVELN